MIGLSSVVNSVMRLPFYLYDIIQRPQKPFCLLDGKVVHPVFFTGFFAAFLFAGIDDGIERDITLTDGIGEHRADNCHVLRDSGVR